MRALQNLRRDGLQILFAEGLAAKVCVEIGHRQRRLQPLHQLREFPVEFPRPRQAPETAALSSEGNNFSLYAVIMASSSVSRLAALALLGVGAVAVGAAQTVRCQ